jgi:pimeloyl-ACP methyl ester carboxylesterase
MRPGGTRGRQAQRYLLGFSIGGFVAQEIALIRPALLRRLVLAATGPKGGQLGQASISTALFRAAPWRIALSGR